MADYKKMYALVFGAADDAILGILEGRSPADVAAELRDALCESERMYIEAQE